MNTQKLLIMARKIIGEAKTGVYIGNLAYHLMTGPTKAKQEDIQRVYFLLLREGYEEKDNCLHPPGTLDQEYKQLKKLVLEDDDLDNIDLKILEEIRALGVEASIERVIGWVISRNIEYTENGIRERISRMLRKGVIQETSTRLRIKPSLLGSGEDDGTITSQYRMIRAPETAQNVEKRILDTMVDYHNTIVNDILETVSKETKIGKEDCRRLLESIQEIGDHDITPNPPRTPKDIYNNLKASIIEYDKIREEIMENGEGTIYEIASRLSKKSLICKRNWMWALRRYARIGWIKMEDGIITIPPKHRTPIKRTHDKKGQEKILKHEKEALKSLKKIGRSGG